MKKIMENEMATAMKAGVEGVGAVNDKLDPWSGSAERSYTGDIVGEVQLMAPALLEREQDPSGPKKRLGPSTPFEEPGCTNTTDGVTVSNATRCSIRTGARYANRDNKMAVNIRRGDRYKVMAFDSPAIILPIK